MTEYIVFITAMFPHYSKDVVYKLIEKGYIVSSANKNCLALFDDDSASAVIALNLKINDKNINKVYDDVEHILAEIKAKYYSLIISDFGSFRFTYSNFSIPKTIKKKEIPSYLKLVEKLEDE
jgi:hypothetical protein